MGAAEHGELDIPSDLCPDGDVILVVGPDNLRLRVHSQCLSCASKVFSAMFGPHWREGQGLSKESPKDIQLEDDNAAALRTICCVIHHRNDAIPQVITPMEVLQIAITADKYDLGVALRYATAEWLQPKGNVDKTEMGYLMAAAYLLGNMEVFVKSSLKLILDYDGSYAEFLGDKLMNQVLPCKAVYLLEERRNQIRAEICQLLIQGQKEACDCGWGKNRKERYALLHVKYGPLEALKVPVSQIIRDMKVVSCEDMARKRHSPGLGAYYHETPPYSETLGGKVKAIKNKVGICLDCLRVDAETPCTFQHE